ncbi:MAG: hypothetical protein RLP09_04340 [Sandaracinaceae bacterium]
MSASVPWKRTSPRYDEVQVGKAIRGRLWREAALLLHWARGHGMHIVPAHSPGISVGAGGSETLRYRVHPQGLAIARIWNIVIRLTDDGTNVIGRPRVTLPSGIGGTSSVFGTLNPANTAFGASFIAVENLPAKSTAVLTDLELQIDHVHGTTPFWIESVSALELPRAVLSADATDLGVDLESLFPGRPMYDAPYQSAGGIARGWAVTQPRRSLVQQWFSPVEITSGAWTDVFTLPHLVVPRKDRRNDTTQVLTWDCWAGAEASTKGEFRIVTGIDGNTDTLSVATGAAPGFLGTSTVEARCEDLSEPDGLPGGVDESVTLQGRVTAGAGAISVQSFNVWEAP